MVYFGRLAAVIASLVWGMHPGKFQRVWRLGSVTAQPNCGVEQRAPPVFGRGPSRCVLAHISSSFFLSSPNLSRRRLDVCHTSTHGVALAQISHAGLKRGARGSLKYRTQKNRHLGTIAQFCRAISSQLRHVSTIGKKHVKQRYVLHMSPQYGELRLTNG